VDRLHQAGGSVPDSVLELHGTAHEVVCVRCEHVSPRPAFQKLLAELNPEIAKRAYADVSLDDTGEASVPKTLKTRPDGDVEVDGEIVANFVVPKCKACGGGPLKPKVVFFGDSVPVETHARATEASQQCDAVLIIGSSVSTFSAFRLVRDAAARNVPVAILTKGETRADDLAQLKVEKLAGETLPLVLRAARRMEMYGY
jgi:NAD-dependent deacetylase sirtuin 4